MDCICAAEANTPLIDCILKKKFQLLSVPCNLYVQADTKLSYHYVLYYFYS